MVLKDLPAQVVAAGVPAKIIGVATEGRPSETVDQNLEHVRYHYHSKAGNCSTNAAANPIHRNDQNVKSVEAGGGGGDEGGRERKTVGVRGIEEKRRSFL